jgi:hypothetical protein
MFNSATSIAYRYVYIEEKDISENTKKKEKEHSREKNNSKLAPTAALIVRIGKKSFQEEKEKKSKSRQSRQVKKDTPRMVEREGKGRKGHKKRKLRT